MFALKLLLVPSLIGALTLAGRRWGPGLAGWLSGFPIVAGPILLMVALEQGQAFAAATSAGALTAVIANIFFCLAYAWLATRCSWWICLLGGYAAFAAAGYLLTVFSLPIHALLPLCYVAIVAAARAFPDLPSAPLAAPPRIELPARMAAGAALIVAVTYFAPYLGPRMSGVFAAPPLLASVLVAFSHPISGAGFAVRLLQGMVSGFFALATFCFLLALLLPATGIAASFALALAGATGLAGLVRYLRSPGRRA